MLRLALLSYVALGYAKLRCAQLGVLGSAMMGLVTLRYGVLG